MNAASQISADRFKYAGRYRSVQLPPCTLSIDQLKRLYQQLEPSAAAALERMLAAANRPADQTEQQFEANKQSMREIAGPLVRIFGVNGEQSSGVSQQVFDDLPEQVSEITFDSAAALQSINVVPLNRFTVTFDFTEPPKIGDYNASGQSTPNRSRIEVIGDDAAWVHGVYETVISFVKDRRRKRNWGWLHSRYTFNVWQSFIAIPAGIWLAYRFDSWIAADWPDGRIVLRSAIFIYVIGVVVLLAQALLGNLRWAFPLVELERSRTASRRTAAGGVAGALLIALIYDVLKTVFWPTP